MNVDVNSFQRKFVNEVRRCDEMERKLRYVETEINKDKVSVPDVQDVPHAPNPREIIDLEVCEFVKIYTNKFTLLSQFSYYLSGPFGENRK